jgi:hypothetical protein
MIRASPRTADGDILIGLTRSSLDKLQEGHSLVSPAFDGRGPRILIVFAEDDRALREKLTSSGQMGPQTRESDRRSS